VQDRTAGVEDGALQFWSYVNGVNYNRLWFASGGLVINESGINSYTRIEGNNDQNLVYVDAANDRVGIGTVSPAELLDVDGTLKTTTLKLGGAVVETVYTLTGTALDPGNGTSQIKTLSGNVTLTDSLASGESMSLKLINGASHTVTFPTMTWVSATGNSAPTLTASDQLVFYKISSTLYGIWTGSSA